MDMKTILIGAGIAFLLLRSCGVQDVAHGVEVVTAGVTEVTNVDPDATMNPACLGAAQEQLSPMWVNMNNLQRFAMGLKVVMTCADGGGK